MCARQILSSNNPQVNKHLERQSAERVERLNMNMEREAIVVRIITIVTLIYLPGTFVSVSYTLHHC